MADSIRLDVDETSGGQRLDAFIAAASDQLSRNRFKTLIKQGQVSVDGATIREPKHRVNPGNRIVVVLPEPEVANPQGESIPLDIVYEDSDLIIINKPAGMVVHPAVGNWTGTLVNALIHHCGDSLSGIGGIKRPGIVHRLDKNTSGLIVIAKHDEAHIGLTRQFADHGRTGPLKRSYHALVWGHLIPKAGRIETGIARSTSNRLKMAVTRTGKTAITHYHVVQPFGSDQDGTAVSWVECNLETGRTHQIRVHMSHLGYPLLGDDDYGSGFRSKAKRFTMPLGDQIDGLGRQALHAFRLGFEHPITGKTLLFERDMPSDMAELKESLSKL